MSMKYNKGGNAMTAEKKMTNGKRELIEKSVQEFQKMNDDNKMFILGYMLGIQQERQKVKTGAQ